MSHKLIYRRLVLERQCSKCFFARTFGTTNGLSAKPKLRFVKEAELPVYDYGKVHAENKRLYVFGCSMHGGLGLADLLKSKVKRGKPPLLYVDHPVRNKQLYNLNVKAVAAGHGFTLVGVKRRNINQGAILGSGLNDYSQLGYQAARQDAPLVQLVGLTDVFLPIKAERPDILALAAGKAHAVLSIKNEGLITWGKNDRGQCGRPALENEKYLGSKYVHRIPEFGESEDSEIVKIASRFDTTVCLSKSGMVYTYGDNTKGQLGKGRIPTNLHVMLPVTSNLAGEKIVDIATNGETVLAVSDDGEVFGWGCNELGLISTKLPRRLLFEPTRLLLPRRIKKVVACGISETCSYLVNENGNVFVWGFGRTLGLGPATEVQPVPTIIPPPLFGQNEFNPDTKVTKVVGGIYHSAAITSTGDIFTWGINKDGCLGLNLKQDIRQSFPLKVSVGGRAFDVAIGVDHTAVLTSGGI